MVSQRASGPERPPIGLAPWHSGREVGVRLGVGTAGSGVLGSSFCPVVLHGASDLVRAPRRLAGFSAREAQSESGMCCWRPGSILPHPKGTSGNV